MVKDGDVFAIPESGNLIFAEYPTYRCLRHGEVQIILRIVVDGEFDHAYCARCLDELLSQHLPVIEKVGQNGVN